MNPHSKLHARVSAGIWMRYFRVRWQYQLQRQALKVTGAQQAELRSGKVAAAELEHVRHRAQAQAAKAELLALVHARSRTLPFLLS